MFRVSLTARRWVQAGIGSFSVVPWLTGKRVDDPRQIRSGDLVKQQIPHDHASHLCVYHSATPSTINSAISGSLAAKRAWEDMPWADKASIFLKAADLIAGKYRYEIMAATMIGQGKNVWQAEIDAAAEVGICAVVPSGVRERH
jgi:1-pyrroline-5-carboxylate dehydrogenase